MRKLLSILAVSAAALMPAAMLAAPALAVQHKFLNNPCSTSNCKIKDGGSQFAKEDVSPQQWSVQGSVDGEFITSQLGNVSCSRSWPFSGNASQFNCLYNNYGVGVFIEQNGDGGCPQTDGVHSAVIDDPCTAHDVNTYWVAVPGGISTGGCGSNGNWLVNVGLTDHEDQYPYGSAMFANTNFLLYAEPREDGGNPDNDDQWCSILG